MGTFIGVYIPVVQNILGVILFLRLAWIVGQAGLKQSYLILTLGTGTSFLTILSMNAIVTNGKIRTGGVYYMVSRSLGPATGGSIGFLYYLAITLASAMYILGSVETFIVWTDLKIANSVEFSMRFYSIVVLACLVLITHIGIGVVSKAGTVFSAFALVSIVCILIGLFEHKGLPEAAHSAEDRTEFENFDGLTGLSKENFKNNLSADYDEGVSFEICLAVFFNACTGILSACNRSVDLKNPSYAIPRGTIAASISTTVLYFLFLNLLAAVADRDALKSLNFIITAEVAWPWKWLVYIGIVMSSTGAALVTLSGAPRILNAIANDEMFPKPLNFLKGKIRNSLFFTAGIITGAICIGSIEGVAPLVTICYLVCYGGVNVACLLLDLVGSPNWRPTWRFYSKFTSCLGVVLCLTMMVLISIVMSIVAIMSAVLIYTYLAKKSQKKNWGDGMEGIRAETARNALLKIDKHKKHVKNWRPHYLALGYVKNTGRLASPGILKLLH